MSLELTQLRRVTSTQGANTAAEGGGENHAAGSGEKLENHSLRVANAQLRDELKKVSTVKHDLELTAQLSLCLLKASWIDLDLRGLTFKELADAPVSGATELAP